MRIHFSNTDRPKAAAKLLVRETENVKLADAQEAIARAIGYRDWYDFTAASKPGTPTTILQAAEWKAVILSVTDALGVGYGDVQYALMRSRVMPDMPLEEALAIRASIWRERLFGPPGRGKPGTVVRIKEPGSKRHAYLLEMGRPAHLLYDTGFGICADFEVVTPRVPVEDFVPSRLWLPYGYWTLADGSIVTFSRDYKPMWRTIDGISERQDPWLWVNEIRGETHFATMAGSLYWSGGAARTLALDHLRTHRIVGLPRLLDAMAFVFDPAVESVGKAVARMRDAADRLAA